VCEGLLFFCREFMRSAVSILGTSRHEEGRLDMAVSASRARFRIQFWACHVGPILPRSPTEGPTISTPTQKKNDT